MTITLPRSLAALTLVIAFNAGAAQSPDSLRFRNAALPLQERVDDLVRRMTL